jgi:hypothetical protein
MGAYQCTLPFFLSILQEEFLPCPGHPALFHNFGCCYIILMGHQKIKIKMNNSIKAPGGHIQITIMIDTQQQYIKLNIRDEISIIVKNKLLTTILRLIRRVRQFERRD